VSGNGWAIGTIGGILCLFIILPLIVMIEGDLIIRASLVITAVFFAVSAAPIFLWLPERAQSKPLPAGENFFGYAFKQLWQTVKTASQFKEFLKFMAAFLIFNDGVIMALNFAAIIGAVLYGMDQTQLIIFVIIVQVSNVGGAYAFGAWVDRLGGKRSLTLSILSMIAAVIWLYLNTSATGFYLVGILAGFAMAGIQSVSRTMVSFFAPPGRSGEFYGFFAVAGRTSSFIGPTVYGFIAAEAALFYQAQGETIASAEQMGQKLAILSIGVFLVVGLIVLSFVNEKKARSFS
ncbi:MAG: MFS transporter, partial [Chloroflexota bacterium]